MLGFGQWWFEKLDDAKRFNAQDLYHRSSDFGLSDYLNTNIYILFEFALLDSESGTIR